MSWKEFESEVRPWCWVAERGVSYGFSFYDYVRIYWFPVDILRYD